MQNLIKTNPQKALEQIIVNLSKATTNLQKAEQFYYLGLTNLALNDFDIANENLHKALDLFDKEQNPKGIADCLTAIGGLHIKLWEFDKALASFYQAQDIFASLNLEEDKAVVFEHIGKVLRFQKQNAKSLEFLNKALAIYEEHDNDYGIAECYNNIGLVYKEEKDFAKAEEFLKKSLKTIGLGKVYQRTIVLINLAELFIEQEKFDIAENNLEEALNYTKDITAKNLEISVWEVWANLHEANSHFENALFCYKNYVKLKQEEFTEEASKRFTRMQAFYETAKKEKEKEIYRLKNIELVKANEIIKTKNDELTAAYKKLDKTSRTDPLTGLSNRRDFTEMFLQEQIRFRRNMRNFTIVLCDIDFFKKFNDTHGHNCGDFVLAKTAKTIRKNLRDQDILARWGGEEFIMLLPETDLNGGRIVAEKIRSTIEQSVYEFEDKKLKVTLTFGVACYNKVLSMEEIIKMADDALYAGKEQGRNIVMVLREYMFTKGVSGK